ncbi:hypothetical protein [Sphaerotilus microaerophilus]|uniref:SMODS and SLOG-associating 2TM effector domain-containing protein n=1 Tax=Sphaerotilus microaerophilus TaxID=2914710 RepID=A0ABM7YPX6_9BURK|nr:hypothetical protein [Sphaerotilus sp. FB-5]BDI06587.1 hypothetical protein CATMQ487_35570 [Sphaerotilus sp. FB-5]
MEEKEARNYAWEHFKLHAAQRFTTFNYFIVLAVLMTTALGTSLNKDFHYPELAFYLSVLLVVTSFVFWKLDQRARQLLEVSKSALKHLELISGLGESEYWMLFQNEVKLTEARKKQSRIWLPHRWHLTYLHCFGTLYALFAVLGILGLYVSWPRLQVAQHFLNTSVCAGKAIAVT